jgi:MFS family permease
MATSAETRVVNAAGVVQGIALVTFPAASTILTDPAEYDLSSSQYGALFLPQVVTAIAAALLGASLGIRFGTKRVYVAGLCAGLVSMILVLASAVVAGDSGAYPLLLLATACLGAALTISFSQKELSAYAAAAAGGVIAFYQLGYGIAAFGVGPLRDAGVELSTVYALAAIVAVAMCVWSFVVAARRPDAASVALQGSGSR